MHSLSSLLGCRGFLRGSSLDAGRYGTLPLLLERANNSFLTRPWLLGVNKLNRQGCLLRLLLFLLSF